MRKNRKNIKSLVSLIFLFFFVFFQTSSANDTLPTIDTFHLGEQLFLGNSPKYDSTYSCSKCHFLNPVDSFLWNQTAYEISVSFADKEISAYEEALLYPMSEKMFSSHEGAENLKEIDFYALKTYLKFVKQQGPPRKKTFPLKKAICCTLLTLIVLLFISRIFFGKIRIHYFHRVLIITAIVFLSCYFYPNLVEIGLQKDYEPDQPIKFSHITHSTQNGTSCFYCHPAARYSASAGMPGVNVCMNCHSLVREGSQSGEKEIKKLIAASEESIPLKWIRINNLPEHVQFNHSIHVEVGKTDCIECHGAVENTARLSLTQSLSMGWCLDCHKTQKVNMKDNGFYQSFKTVSNEFYELKTDSTLIKDLGGWDCMHCHY